MKFISSLFIFTVWLVVNKGENNGLEEVSEDDLLALLRNENYVIVLFSKSNCPKCDELETLLVSMREDLVDALNPWVVKTMNSNMVKLYDPSKEPALVFFRHGVPILYDGDYNEDLILHTFSENKNPVVRELSDDNFESLTQAASGATTGDWFIMFYSNDCIDCQRMQARWESVAAKLKTRMNVARMNRKGLGRATARRFHIIEEPSFVLFRLGKMYRYNLPRYDIPTFASFATDWYKNAKGEKVPLPKTPFDDLILIIVEFIRENMLVLQLCGAVILMISLVYLLKSKSKKQEKKPKEKVAKSTEAKSTEEKSKKIK